MSRINITKTDLKKITITIVCGEENNGYGDPQFGHVPGFSDSQLSVLRVQVVGLGYVREDQYLKR